jgi:ABC-type sulfate transport system permease component
MVSQQGKTTMKRVLPGFGLSLGFTLVYLSLLILLPLSGLVFKASSLSFEQFWAVATGDAGARCLPGDLRRVAAGGG